MAKLPGNFSNVYDRHDDAQSSLEDSSDNASTTSKDNASFSIPQYPPNLESYQPSPLQQASGQMAHASRFYTADPCLTEALHSNIIGLELEAPMILNGTLEVLEKLGMLTIHRPQEDLTEVPTECEITILDFTWKVPRKDLVEKSGFFSALFQGYFKVCQYKKRLER